MLDSVVKARNGTGAPTAADSAALRAALQGIIDKMVGAGGPPRGPGPVPRHHRLSGDRAGRRRLRRLRAAARHPRSGAPGPDRRGRPTRTSPTGTRRRSTTTAPRCSSPTSGAVAARRSAAPPTGTSGAPTPSSRIDRRQAAVPELLQDAGAADRAFENCVAHNGSLIPIPGRDIMVQSWYQGGVSVFDWTDPEHPKEIAFFDRGPVDSTRLAMGGSWSAYWYNGVIVLSEIARGLDILELTPSPLLSQNEIDAAKTVHLDQLNVQDQHASAGRRASRWHAPISTSWNATAGSRPGRLPPRARRSPMPRRVPARVAAGRCSSWRHNSASRAGCPATRRGSSCSWGQ